MLASRDDDIELVFLGFGGTQLIVDSYGIIGQSNTGTAAEFEDGRAERLPFVRAPDPFWIQSEWNITADDPAFVLPSPNYDPGEIGLAQYQRQI